MTTEKGELVENEEEQEELNEEDIDINKLLEETEDEREEKFYVDKTMYDELINSLDELRKENGIIKRIIKNMSDNMNAPKEVKTEEEKEEEEEELEEYVNLDEQIRKEIEAGGIEINE